jgi:putative phosphoesterase
MKVALIGDVHANLPALEAVLAHAAGQGVKAIWNVGDFVGYGAFPDEVVTRLRHASPDMLSIVGNYDLKALRSSQKKDKLPQAPDKRLAFQWAYDHLSPDNRAYLRSLPQEIRLEVEGQRILLTHGSPDSNDEHLTPETPEERLRELAQMAEADVILCGHSHQPFARQAAGVWFVNSGSVGRPDDGDPRACYAILQITPNLLQAHHYRVAYDVERAAAAIRERGLPEAFAQVILQGRNLNRVKPAEEPMPKKNEHSRLEAVLQLAESCHYAADHTHQVTRLALQLFDELQSLHRLGAEERLWLQYAALLHDIGWIEGQPAHHKTALRIILTTPGLPFDARERHIIGSIARYHRKALPDEKHEHFAALEPDERQKVRVLAGLLRVADGLDCTHQSVVSSLSCEVTSERLVVRCSVIGQSAKEERQEALDKGVLLEQVFGRKLVIV